MSKTLAQIALAAAAFGAAVPAVASESGSPDRAFQVAIPVADLDLGTAAGRAALERRFRDVAERTCAPEPFPAQYEPRSLRACRASFRAAAEAAIERRTGARMAMR